MPNKLSIEEMNHFCKKKGFVYQNSEIYGGLSGFWDFGPLGVELKNIGHFKQVVDGKETEEVMFVLFGTAVRVS